MVKEQARRADPEGVGSIVLLVALLVVVGLLLGGWLVLGSSDRTQDALERDEREISRGRDVGAR